MYPDTNGQKSPPRWPLRPGVMLHVNNETKENLVVNRTTIKQDSIKNNEFGNVTTDVNHMLIAPQTESFKKNFLSKMCLWSKKRVPTKSNENDPPKFENENVTSTDTGVSSIYVDNIDTEVASSSSYSYNVLERIIYYIKRAKRPSQIYTRDSQRSQVCLLRTIWRRHAYDGTNCKLRDHRLKGIRCSGSGIV